MHREQDEKRWFLSGEHGTANPVVDKFLPAQCHQVESYTYIKSLKTARWGDQMETTLIWWLKPIPKPSAGMLP